MKNLTKVAVVGLAIASSYQLAYAFEIPFIGPIYDAITSIVDDMPQIVQGAIAIPEGILSFTGLLSGGGAGALSGTSFWSQMGSLTGVQATQQTQTNNNAQAANTQYAGSTDPYSQQLNSYRQGSQYCDSNNNCYPTTSATQAYNTTQYQSQGQQIAAQQYTTNVAGVGPAKPNYQHASPEAVRYTAAYNNQTAIQSNSIGSVSDQVSGRTPTNGGSGSSPSASRQNVLQNFQTNSGFAGIISNFSIPLLSPILSAAQALPQVAQSVSHVSSKMDNVNTNLSGLQSSGSNLTNVSQTQQLQQQAQTAESGNPTGKNANE